MYTDDHQRVLDNNNNKKKALKLMKKNILWIYVLLSVIFFTFLKELSRNSH